MRQFFHYTDDNKVANIIKSGIFPNHPYFTLDPYYNAFQAGSALGISPHNITCVLAFSDDNLFVPFSQLIVPSSGKGFGGATQYQHPYRPKPIAIRGITEKKWNFI